MILETMLLRSPPAQDRKFTQSMVFTSLFAYALLIIAPLSINLQGYSPVGLQASHVRLIEGGSRPSAGPKHDAG